MKNGLYELVVAPAGYPGKLYRGKYVYEHQLVWWQNTGELVVEPMLIHHKNEQKRDNRFENLEKKSRSKHSSEHRQAAPKITATCSWCSNSFTVAARNWHFRKQAVNNHCSRSCSAKHQFQLGKSFGR